MIATTRPATCRRVVSALVVVPLALWLASATAYGEARKFVVLLADIPKDAPGEIALPNRANVWDAYFDKVKNAEPGQTGVRVDSFAEWWEEVSYGEVTVTGNVYGWVQLPWPSKPSEITSGFGIIRHIDLQGGFSMQPGTGEGFSNGLTRYKFDRDGVGENGNWGNGPAFELDGLEDIDALGNDVWAPGERFLDIAPANDQYDAGVYEWGIDKNGNGRIDVDKPANSFASLFSVTIAYPPEGAPDTAVPTFTRWNNDTEWFDSNNDGIWNQDHLWDDQSGQQEIRYIDFFRLASGNSIQMNFYRGDWGGTEIWIDADGDFTVGEKAVQDDRVRGQGGSQSDQPASIWEFLIEVNDPENQDGGPEYFDEQWNDGFDYPEPFEDYMRRWDADAHDWVPVTDQYIIDNYPGNAALLIARTGNGRYDSPDFWGNNGNVNSTNKLQEINPLLIDAAEQNEQFFRGFPLALPPEASGWSLDEFWQDRYGTSAPNWRPDIPYLRRFDPGSPRPQRIGDTEAPKMPFDPDLFGFSVSGGGPFNNGTKEETGAKYTIDDGRVHPNIGDANFGLYDGPREYDDLPSSIYHSGGDLDFGEIVGPQGKNIWGSDVGTHNPNSPSVPDSRLPAAGPLAVNIHGDGGWDGGNQLTVEYLTWRTNGENNTDLLIVDDFGLPSYEYHKDTNLDGMIDMGESPGLAGSYGLPNPAIQHNYGVDYSPGTPNNGGPANLYPFNRQRMMEDTVEALDDSVNWNEFLGGPPPFGDVISGFVLVSARTAPEMFRLPAASLNLPIRTRDVTVSGVQGRDHYVPITFFNGLGITTDSATRGEGSSNSGIEGFQSAWSCHEWGHTWEGFPDLYDYDITRDGFDSPIINNPIGRWCIMASGGLVHPVPILKVASGWLTPVDLTTVLDPLGSTTIDIPAWEFNRTRSVYGYVNPNPQSPGEIFWFWRNSPGVITNGQITRLAMDWRQPGIDLLNSSGSTAGYGMLIMHVDLGANPNSTPPQQRIGSHFTYNIVQSDGFQELENGDNIGDSADPWPGSDNVRVWNRETDPDNRWYDGSGSGLDITNVVQKDNSTAVTFRWTPRELPSFRWVQPPGGTSNQGVYTLRYFTYDQRGGTQIQFYVDTNSTGYDGLFLTSTGKSPGDIDGATNVNIGGLPNGTYQFYAKLVPGPTENRVSIPRGNAANQGNGTMEITNVDVDLAVSLLEVWTARCTNDTVRNKEEWSVTGSLSGVQDATAITGQLYQADAVIASDGQPHRPMQFRILAGGKRFRAGDTFTFVTTGFTPYSEAVLIFEGNVVTPQPPVARIQGVDPTSGLANWTEFTFRSSSSDPGDADFTETWSFGDGENSPTQTLVPSTVKHTFRAAGQYTVTLRATNSFNLSSQATIKVVVNDPRPPVARLNAAPLEGRVPLRVTLDGSASTDQNDAALGGSELTYRWTLSDGTVLDPVAGSPVTADYEVHTGPAQGPFDIVVKKPGVQVVNLTVTNEFGRSASTSATIRSSGPPSDRPPVALITSNVRSGAGPLSVSFDGSGSRDPEGGLLNFSWNFGDGSPVVTGVSTVDHVFTRARTYNVTLTVTDAAKLTDSATLAIVVTSDAKTGNIAPVARITTSATQGAVPFTVTFDGSTSADPEGGPLSYAWDFGDGSAQALGAVVSHAYNDARTFSAVLVVSDKEGARGAATVSITATLPSDGSGRGTPDNGNTSDDGGTPTTGGGLCPGFGLFPLTLSLAGMVGLRRRRTRR